MSVQPVPRYESDERQARVPRTVDGIAGALSPGRRMEFYREVGQAPVERLQEVVITWWAHAVLDSDPHQERIIAAARAGTLVTGSMESVLQRRRALGGDMPGA